MRTPIELYDELISVDYSLNHYKDKIVADLSFTYFHWKLAEIIKTNSKFNIKNYQAVDLQTLSLNIFPNGDTILHYAHKHLHIIRRFYKVIEKEDARRRQIAEEDGSKVTNFEIPFIKNFDGDTSIHLCIKNQNYKSADVILSKLCNTGIDSHSR